MKSIRDLMEAMDKLSGKSILTESPADVQYVTKMKNMFNEMEASSETPSDETVEMNKSVEDHLQAIEDKLASLVSSDEETHKEYEDVMDSFKSVLEMIKKSLQK